MHLALSHFAWALATGLLPQYVVQCFFYILSHKLCTLGGEPCSRRCGLCYHRPITFLKREINRLKMVKLNNKMLHTLQNTLLYSIHTGRTCKTTSKTFEIFWCKLFEYHIYSNYHKLKWLIDRTTRFSVKITSLRFYVPFNTEHTLKHYNSKSPGFGCIHTQPNKQRKTC